MTYNDTPMSYNDIHTMSYNDTPSVGLAAQLMKYGLWGHYGEAFLCCDFFIFLRFLGAGAPWTLPNLTDTHILSGV
jgi:hypothetical protein